MLSQGGIHFAPERHVVKDGPEQEIAILFRDRANNIVIHEQWVRSSRDGKSYSHHRVGGPAIVDRDHRSGAVTCEEFWVNGQLCDGVSPSIQTFDSDSGVVIGEIWTRSGLKHREGAAAHIERHPKTGTVILEEWWIDGKKHRDDGPAIIFRDEKGNILSERWYTDGIYRHAPSASDVRGIKTNIDLSHG
jgi:hypothetical protein